MTTTDHDELLERVSRIAKDERSQLAALARGQGLSPEDAIDCVQDALCTMLSLGRRGKLPKAPEEWGPLLAGIVRNTARNRRRRHFLSQPHEDYAAHPCLAASTPQSDEVLSRAETHLRLHACVGALCEVQRAVVTLRMLEEQSGEDVAQALGIPSGRVAVLLYRAKQVLRVCMGEAQAG